MTRTLGFFIFYFLWIESSFGSPNELDFNPSLDVPMASLGLVGIGSLTLFEKELGPSYCRWCDRNSMGESSLNGIDSSVRNHLRWSDPSLANNLSHVTAYALAPLWAFGANAWAASQNTHWNYFRQDAISMIEAVTIAGIIGETVQFSVGRERPLQHFRTPYAKSHDNTSFYSGHTNISFALATASGTIASLRHYSVAPLIWGIGLSIAATSAYLRMAADRHYFIDVAVGAAAGSLIGFCVPFFLHKRVRSDEKQNVFNLEVFPSDRGATLLAKWFW